MWFAFGSDTDANRDHRLAVDLESIDWGATTRRAWCRVKLAPGEVPGKPPPAYARFHFEMNCTNGLLRSVETVSHWLDGREESNRTPTEWVAPSQQGGPDRAARTWLCDDSLAGTTRKLLEHWRVVHAQLRNPEGTETARARWAREQLGILLAIGFEPHPGDVDVATAAPPDIGVYELLKKLKLRPPR